MTELLKPIKPFDDYMKKIIEDLQLEIEEKDELEEEWKQHLYDHFESLVKQNIEEEKAVQTVLEQFGEIALLQEEVNRTYPSSKKIHIQKEITIGIIAFIASIIGPGLLIGAHFQSYFVIAPIQALMVAYLVYRFLIKQQKNWILSLIGFGLIYVFFLQLLPKIMGTSLTFAIFVNEIFSFQLERLTGSNGLFEFVTLHMMWYVIIAFQFISNKNFIPVWQRVINASFHYWAMLLIGVMVARFQSSAEWRVLYLNVFLLYAFLQQTISIKGIMIFKEKVYRLLVRQNV